MFQRERRGPPRITFMRILPRSSQADLVYYVVSWIHAVFPYISVAVAVSFSSIGCSCAWYSARRTWQEDERL